MKRVGIFNASHRHILLTKTDLSAANPFAHLPAHGKKEAFFLSPTPCTNSLFGDFSSLSTF